jgi:hypothetical protein
MKIVKKAGKAYLVVEQELKMNSKGEIEWCIIFVDGWNSVWAKTFDAATRLAYKTYSNDKIYQIKKIFPMTVKIESDLLSSFH